MNCFFIQEIEKHVSFELTSEFENGKLQDKFMKQNLIMN